MSAATIKNRLEAQEEPAKIVGRRALARQAIAPYRVEEEAAVRRIQPRPVAAS